MSVSRHILNCSPSKLVATNLECLEKSVDSNKPFQECWKFPSDIKRSIGAHHFTIDEQTNLHFMSGRAKLLFKFYDENNVCLSECDAMILTSKLGKQYYVVSVTDN